MTDEEKSLSDYVDECWDMNVRLLYTDTEDGIYRHIEDEVILDELWASLDLWFPWVIRVLCGRCSLAQFIDFDLEKEILAKHARLVELTERYG